MDKHQVAGTDLAVALAAVLPHAGTDLTLPILAAVKFETRDGGLVLATTDKYTLATYRLDWTGDDVDFVLARSDAQELLSFAKKAKVAPVTLRFDGRALVATDFDRSVSFVRQEGEFPRVHAVLPEPREAQTCIGFNPHMLARLAKGMGAKDQGPAIMRIGLRNKPVRVEIGDRFVGVVMPVRLPDNMVTPEPATVEAPAPEPVEEVEVEVDAEAVAEIEAALDTADDTDLCTTCKGFGVVRGSGPKAGLPYKTRNGALGATNPVECPACEGDLAAAV